MGALDQFSVAFEDALAGLMSMLKFHINDYCDLETTYDDCIVAKDGSMATILRYNGFKTLIGRGDFENLTDELSNGLEQYLGSRGHQIQFVFHKDRDCSDEIARMLAPSYETAERLGLDLTDLLDEKQEVMGRLCMSEHVFIVLWTRPAILDPAEVKVSADEARDIRQKYKIPSMKNAQNILRPVRYMVDKHESFVATFVQDLIRLKGSVDRIDAKVAIRTQKKILYANTPENWEPIVPEDDNKIIVRWKNDSSKDISSASYPRLDDQLFSSPGVIGSAKKGKKAVGIGGVTDLNAVRIGSRIFAPLAMKTPPKRPRSFSSLFESVNQSGAENAAGEMQPIPWSLSITLEGDGLKGIGIKKIFAGILSWTSSDNRNLTHAAKALAKYRDNENGCVVKMQISAMTWTDAGEEQQLLMQRSKLSGALQGWGNTAVDEEMGDPLGAVMAGVPGLMLRSGAPESAPPLHDAARMLPLARPASPYSRGTTLLRTRDGKVMPYEIFSDQQTTWITTIFGGPGSGKSVFSNRLNEEMCLLGGLRRLPYICAIDIGISSSGFISLIQDSLAEDRKHLAVYKRLQNTDEYCVNQFDTQLMMRFPLPREREAMKNFLVRLATPPDRDKPHAFMDAFVGRVIDEAFKRKSDTFGSPNVFAMNVNAKVAEGVKKHGIEVTEATKWWDIADAFFAKGLDYLASVAQRYAMPILFDMLKIASDPQIIKEYGGAVDANNMSVVEEFTLMINSARGDFKIFGGYTQFDIGEARVMSLDLQDVVTVGSAAAKKQASLMYMVALNAFMRKVSIIKEDLDLIPTQYRQYHARRVEDLAEDYKRLFCDEYHKTGGDKNLQEMFLIYGRESRKWLLEIVLASQLPEDFKDISKIATTILILDAGNETTRGTIRDVFGLSDTESAALQGNVRGPNSKGSTFLAKIKTKSAELSQLFTASSGALELWGLSTTGEDRALRNLLYKEMPSYIARRILKERFKTGSCQEYVLNKKSESKDVLGDSFVDDDVEQSVIQKIAAELIEKWRLNKTDYSR